MMFFLGSFNENFSPYAYLFKRGEPELTEIMRSKLTESVLLTVREKNLSFIEMSSSVLDFI